jgi:hypothetical protein
MGGYDHEDHLHRSVRQSQVTLVSHTGFGECRRDRLLREIVQNECRPAGNDEGDKTGKQECTHHVSPIS